jgi:Ca-activated chloride channel family protein
MPFTRDYAAADMMVRSSGTSLAGSQGTAIGDAIRMAMKRTKEPGSRVIILVTDGEDHDSDAVEAAESAATEGWMIVTIGVGTEAGGTVPDSDEAGAPPKMSEDGTPVISRLNVPLLQELAGKGKGKYFPLDDEKALITAIGEQIEKAGKREMEVRSFTEYETYYAWFLACGLLCLLVPVGRRIMADLMEKIDGNER